MRTGLESGASGSALVEFGRTKVLASVHGPQQAGGGAYQFSTDSLLRCEAHLPPWSRAVRPLDTRDLATEERALARSVRQAVLSSVDVSKYPKSVIHAGVLVLEDDGSVEAAAIVATSLALVDAGIETFDLVPAVTLVTVPGSDESLLDPSSAETARASGSTSFSFLPGSGDITRMEHVGAAAVSTLATALEVATRASALVHAAMRAAVLTTTRRRLRQSLAAEAEEAEAEAEVEVEAEAEAEEGEAAARDDGEGGKAAGGLLEEAGVVSSGGGVGGGRRGGGGGGGGGGVLVESEAERTAKGGKGRRG